MKSACQLFAALVVFFLLHVAGSMPANAAPAHEIAASFLRSPQTPGSGALLLGSDGYFWGTGGGGAYGCGTIYKVKADGSDWTTVLSFTGNGENNKGAGSGGGLVSDGAGYLWGTTEGGGAHGYGTVF